MEHLTTNLKQIGGAAALIFGLAFIWNLPPQTPENFRKYLEAAGYAEVRNIAPKVRACTRHSVNFAFTAKNPSGRQVSGEACMAHSFVHSIREYK